MELQEPKAKEWSLIPADVYQTEITKIDYKEIDNKWRENESDPLKKQVMEFEFTIIEEGPHYGRKLWKQMAPIKPYPPTGGKESWVYRIASAIAGHPITREEADKYTATSINDFFHLQIRVTVSVTAPKDNGKQYNNIDGFLTIKAPLPKFDENKVPKEDQTEVTEDPKNEPPVSPDIAEIADQLKSDAGEDISVEDIPF